METNNQKPAQYEWGPFSLGDGMSVLDIRYDVVFKAVFTRNTEKSRGALSALISALIGRTVKVETMWQDYLSDRTYMGKIKFIII